MRVSNTTKVTYELSGRSKLLIYTKKCNEMTCYEVKGVNLKN